MKNKSRIIKYSILVTIFVLFMVTFRELQSLYSQSLSRNTIDEFNTLFNSPGGSNFEKIRSQVYTNLTKEIQAPYLEIKDCKSEPKVIKIIGNRTLLIKNSGDQDREFTFQTKKYKVYAQGQVLLPLQFPKNNPYAYAKYHCDTTLGSSGAVQLIPAISSQTQKNVTKKLAAVTLRGIDPIINPVLENAPSDVKAQKIKDYKVNAKESPYLEIKDCKADPLIIRITNKPTLTIKNSGDQNRRIKIHQLEILIPAHSQISESPDLEKISSYPLIWYVCDLYPTTAAGIIWIDVAPTPTPKIRALMER